MFKMGMGDTLTKEIKGWITLAMFIVVGSVVLLKFKGVSGVTAGLNTTIDSFVTAFSEPSSWVAIAIIAIIGYGIMKYFQGKK